MDAAAFKRWLKATMGLDAEAVGPGVVERAIAGRMRALGVAEADAYWRRLQAQPLEQQELIEAVVVPETWFFRGVEAFDALALAFASRLSEPGNAPLRLLSLPCSTGEEPYTLAMALLDAGWPPQRLRIDAYDISERALAKAGHAVYGANSFRGGDLRYRDRHFRALGHGRWQLSDAVRGCVRLHRANVLAIDFLPEAASFDAVFCRNLLIYFDQDTQVRAVGVLARALAAGGLLFVGAAETGLLLSLGYASAQIPMAAAFRNQRSAPVPRRRRSSRGARRRWRHAGGRGVRARSRPSPPRWRRALRRPRRPRPRRPPTTRCRRRAASPTTATSLQAERLCQAHLRAHGPNAEALCLLGVIYGADGADARAEDAFRKALYLQPDHAESLMHLALLLDAKGDAAGARLMRQRAARHRDRNP
ncbi:chemotaxis protein CheW [Lysobacter enzymogenes]|nr:CheR family methyltransferase [Lysobacter enzymogenes]QCW26321.1 chemotaxis protein CheW [Lysobacter enzymogenes]